MKLRFVKFFTSRENEIEKKEGGEGRSPAITRSTTSQLARSHSPASAPRSCLHHFHSSSLHPAPSARSSTTPVSPPPRNGRAMPSSYPSPPPAIPLLPSFFIKLLKQHSVEGRTVAWYQLADPAVACGHPARLPARAFR